MNTTRYIELGKIQRVQGLQGKLVVRLNHDIPHLNSLSSLFIRINHTLVPYRIEQLFWQRHKVILKLQGVDDLEAAHYLQGRYMLILQEMLSQLSPQGAHLVDRLLGYHVVNAHEDRLGVVQAIYKPAQQKLLAIDCRGKELLVPYHEDIVTHVDHAQQTITVQLPNGYIETMS